MRAGAGPQELRPHPGSAAPTVAADDAAPFTGSIPERNSTWNGSGAAYFRGDSVADEEVNKRGEAVVECEAYVFVLHGEDVL